MKNIALIILILFLYNCGYSSIYKSQKQDFQINFVEARGDNEMNNLIKNEIKLYMNKNSSNLFNIKIDTNYKKEILTKDSSGVTTDYKLSVKSLFTINSENKIKQIQFNENINIKKQADNFQQDEYEKDIKRNFASSIREKLIFAILNINDN